MIVSAGPLVRCSALLTVSATATVVAVRGTARLRHPNESSYDDLLVAGAAWALVLCAAWAGLACAAAVLEVISAGRLPLTSFVGCPPPARRALLAGVVLASGSTFVACPVSATPAPLEREPLVQGDRLDLPVPARPIGTTYAGARQRIKVERGDSLWRLAQQREPTASPPRLARLVARTYRANRRVIGPDPDLIKPGQRLLVHPEPQYTPPHPDTRRETP